MIGLNLPWILAHLIGDYLLQNDWMAENKKKRKRLEELNFDKALN
jgi:hypothetical protein